MVDTEKVLTDERKILQSNKTALWFEGENEILTSQNSPKGSFLERVYRYKNSNPIRMAPKDFSYDIGKALTECFWICDLLKGRILGKIFAALHAYNIFYDENNPYYSALGTFIRIKSNSRKYKVLDEL